MGFRIWISVNQILDEKTDDVSTMNGQYCRRKFYRKDIPTLSR